MLHMDNATQNNRYSGFTLIDLLVVIAIIAFFAACVTPNHSNAKKQTQGASCLGNLKKLQIAWQMYADDNAGRLPINASDGNGAFAASPPNSWVTGDAKLGTNEADIRNGTIFRYDRDTRIYRCPSDLSLVYQSTLPRLRSYSMNAWLSGMPESPVNYSQVSTPSQVFVLLDEEENSIDDGFFLIRYSPDSTWPNMPSDRHACGANLSFADGHCERYGWKAPKHFAGLYLHTSSPADAADLAKLQAALPILP